ncbi:hypothetical protein DERF_004709 [Dermatophagoides farinae]|uniref:Uncharacterized protein n=1 Tax=Dermatophagoides farinae TaxID=6954 RepID=A0A922I4A4_DERFA|nr:hypothetical protein DERF_004709 [Dermatophagoides farinae]
MYNKHPGIKSWREQRSWVREKPSVNLCQYWCEKSHDDPWVERSPKPDVQCVARDDTGGPKYRAAVVNARVTGMYTLYDTSLNVDINDNIINDSTSKLTTIIREPSVQPPSRIFIKSIKTNHGIGSAFMADLFTMINATCWLKNQNNNQTTYIITNNISTVQHVNRQDRKNRQRLANELIDNIENNIVIVWNKIDKGENWYRKLKKYARSTANNQQRQVDYQRVPMSFIKKFEQNRMLISWNDIYRRDRFGSNIRMICPNVQDARMYTPYINKFVTQTITGHGQFGAYLSKFGISDDKKCCCGHPFQSVAHLINDCRMLNRLRRDYRQSTSHITDPKTRIKLTATFFENIAIFADDHRSMIDQSSTPLPANNENEIINMEQLISQIAYQNNPTNDEIKEQLP